MPDTIKIEQCPHADIPEKMRALPTDPDRPHFHVPWFVAWINGKPDYRVVESGRILDALRNQKCWLCGQRLGTLKAFIIGPMCSITRTTSEPPSHLSCAAYAVTICPFLTQPRMRRNEKDLPEARRDAPGIHLHRNPGCTLIWITKTFQPFRAGDGLLFQLGDPYSLTWWSEGRAANREEVLSSIETCLPALQEIAQAQGTDAIRELDSLLMAAMRLLPAAAAIVDQGAPE